MEHKGEIRVDDNFPGTILTNLKKLGMPYGLYVNPYTGYFYATDAGGFVEAGALYQWANEGNMIGKYGVYINPAHFLALKPNNWNSAIGEIEEDDFSIDSPIYNLQGIRVTKPVPGQLYIRNGKKFIYQP